MRTYQTLGPLAEVAPQILQHFDFDKAARSIADAFGVPNDVLKSEEAVGRERQAMMEQIMAEQQATAQGPTQNSGQNSGQNAGQADGAAPRTAQAGEGAQ